MDAHARAPARSVYSAAAISLHWAIALAIFLMIPLGWWMADAIKDPATRTQAYAAFQLHKSIGLTVLALSVARLGLRLVYPPPPLPDGMPAWQRPVAHATHWALYAVMIGLPLTGWIYVSTGFTADGQKLAVPTLYFGLFEWPHMSVADAPEAVRRNAAKGSMAAHSALAWGAIVLAALHAGAALKHQFVDKDGLLLRMVPGLPGGPSPTPQRRAALIAGFALIAVAGAGIAGALANLPTPAPRAPAETASEPPPAMIAEAEPAAPTPSPATPAATAPKPAEPPAAPEASPPAPAAAAGPPPAWAIDMAGSEVGFSGTHAGAAFDGAFQRWRADVRFSPDNLAASQATVTFETASAKTGDATRDGALPGAEWFDAGAHPTARFEATSFRALGGDRYEARGRLTIRGKTTPVTLPFTFTETAGAAEVRGALTLDRVALGMGLESDPNAEWVSREIRVTIRLKARRSA